MVCVLITGVAVTALTEWKRPFRQQRIAPRDFLLRVGPVTWSPPMTCDNGSTRSYHVWLEQGLLWGVPQVRLHAAVHDPTATCSPCNQKPMREVFNWHLRVLQQVVYGECPQKLCSKQCIYVLLSAIMCITASKLFLTVVCSIVWRARMRLPTVSSTAPSSHGRHSPSRWTLMCTGKATGRAHATKNVRCVRLC